MTGPWFTLAAVMLALFASGPFSWLVTGGRPFTVLGGIHVTAVLEEGRYRDAQGRGELAEDGSRGGHAAAFPLANRQAGPLDRDGQVLGCQPGGEARIAQP